MPLALPGYVDTTITKSSVVSSSLAFDASVGWSPSGYTAPGAVDAIRLGDWTLYNRLDGSVCVAPGVGPGYQGTFELWLANSTAAIPGGTPDLKIHSAGFA